MQEHLKKRWERKRHLHIFSSVSTSCCRRSIFSRLCQEKGVQMNTDRSALMSGNILEKVGKKDVGTTGKNDLPFSPCVPPEFLLESGEEHLEGPGNKKRGDRVGGTEVARDTDPENNRYLSHSLPPPYKKHGTFPRPVEVRWFQRSKTRVCGQMLSTNLCWSVTREVQKMEEFRNFYSNQIELLYTHRA